MINYYILFVHLLLQLPATLVCFLCLHTQPPILTYQFANLHFYLHYNGFKIKHNLCQFILQKAVQKYVFFHI